MHKFSLYFFTLKISTFELTEYWFSGILLKQQKYFCFKSTYILAKKEQLPFCSCSFFIFHVLISSGRMQINSVSFYRQIGHSQFAFAICSWTQSSCNLRSLYEKSRLTTTNYPWKSVNWQLHLPIFLVFLFFLYSIVIIQEVMFHTIFLVCNDGA